MASATRLDYRVNTVDHDIICALDSISAMAESMDRLGVSRALVVCGPITLEHYLGRTRSLARTVAFRRRR